MNDEIKKYLEETKTYTIEEPTMGLRFVLKETISTLQQKFIVKLYGIGTPMSELPLDKKTVWKDVPFVIDPKKV